MQRTERPWCLRSRGAVRVRPVARLDVPWCVSVLSTQAAATAGDLTIRRRKFGGCDIDDGAWRKDDVQWRTPSSSGLRLAARPKHRSLARVLESESDTAEWAARHRQETALTHLLRKHLPRPIADRVRVTDTRGGILELAASAGAIAATLRQRAPDLRAALARDGCDFTQIRVRVQVAGIVATPQKRTMRQWDSAAAAPMFELGERLRDGPLKAALARWSRRARGR